MGTHPIFESDFDCLTDRSSALGNMRAELCHFSGLKIHPGHGMSHCRADGKVECSTTRLPASTTPRRTPESFDGPSSTDARTKRVSAKKLQKPEIRQKQRENAIRAAKDKKKASEANKKAARSATVAKGKAAAPVAKQMKKGGAGKAGGKR